MIKWLFVCLLSLVISPYSLCSVDKPTITSGSWYDMTEHYNFLIDKIEAPVIF